MIETVAFGKLVFKGKVSRSDTIVYSDHMDTRWWIKRRNIIDFDDLDDVLKLEPEIITVGLGFDILIKINDETVVKLQSRGIEVFVGNTEDAVEKFNNNFGKRRVVGLFHLI